MNATDTDIQYARTSFEYYFSIGLTNYHIAKGMKRRAELPLDLKAALLLVNPTKYNLGSKELTMSIEQGWVNVEYFPNNTRINGFLKSRAIEDEERSVYLNFDLSQGFPAEDGSLDYVYHSLLLDCFDYEHALWLLDNIYGSLKPGGRHRIVVLNYAAINEAYARKDPNLTLIQHDIFGNKMDVNASGIFSTAASNLSALWLREGIKSFWDFDSLSVALGNSGFTNIQCSSMAKSDESEIKLIESRYGDVRERFCLFVDCVKA